MDEATRKRPLSRRAVLAGAALSGIGALSAGFSPSKAAVMPRGSADPFSLGVASGDPMPDGVVLWTRLAPDPLAADGHGGMPDRKVVVHWEVARDERFRAVVRRGHKFAVPELAHSVHAEVSGLDPSREYFYRFRTGEYQSPVARTRTAPTPGAALRELRFGVVSCQAWWPGFYTAYRHLAEDELQVVFHLGDYIYEGDIPADGANRQVRLPGYIRAEPWDLTQYRNRHALFRTDSDLQTAHATFPFVLTWDDHDVDDDWAGDHSKDPGVSPEEFRHRRAAAVQAYYEHLPLRLPQKPEGASIKLYRRLTYGDLATFHVLDERLYRDDQGCGDGGSTVDCKERLDPSRTMLGFPQERWLYNGLSDTHTTWNMLANQVPMAQVDNDPGEPLDLFMDAWDGYKPSRDRLFDVLTEHQVANPVVFTGDRHHHHAIDLKTDFADPDSRTLGVEFVGTSVSSGGDGEVHDAYCKRALAANPHVKYASAQRGYIRMTATPELCRGEHLVLPYIAEKGAPISTGASFVTEAGNPGLQHDTGS